MLWRVREGGIDDRTASVQKNSMTNSIKTWARRQLHKPRMRQWGRAAGCGRTRANLGRLAVCLDPPAKHPCRLLVHEHSLGRTVEGELAHRPPQPPLAAR
jgi:hypothetical protein